MAQATHKNTRAAAEQKAHRQPKTDKPRRAAKPPREEHVQKESVQPKRARPARATKDKGRIRVIPLGGLQEIGKNLTVIEYENDLIAVDCGLAFPEEDMLGVDLVIPDITYLEQNADRLRGIFLTHGHEDHIGALPYVLRSIQPPIFGTKLTLDLRTVSAGDTIRAGAMSVEFIRVNHSIADACALAIHTPLGTLVHTGDYKLDLTPIQGEMMNITRLGELGQKGVLMLLGESTNAERPGFTPSEKRVGKSLEYIFRSNPKKRIVIATFSSNVHRVQQIINISAEHGRKVAITGRSMLNIVGAAVELGYMKLPKDVLVDINEIKRFKPEQITLVTTGSQGEPMSALYRMAYSDHNQVTLGQNDLVVLSSSAIPGNEKLVGRVINELSRNGVQVLHDNDMDVHVSGHACREELKMMLALTKPRYFMPIHGESRHLCAHRELAQEMGVPDANIFVSEIGKVLEIDAKGARYVGVVPAGQVLIDGYGVGDVGSAVLRDRRLLSQDGLIVVVATVDEDSRLLLCGPELISRGFVYVKDNEPLMEEARQMVQRTLLSSLSSRKASDRTAVKIRVKDELSRFLFQRTGRRPVILPVIMSV